MYISIPEFKNGEAIPQKFTCDGENISPRVEFKEVPNDVQSLALVVDDPDAPGGVFMHWMIWNIHPLHSYIAEGSVPDGVAQGKTDFGFSKYGGPCPPSGNPHHYRFRLFALDAMLLIPQGAGRVELAREIEKHLITKAEYVGVYKR